jgi:hypothetical protein
MPLLVVLLLLPGIPILAQTAQDHQAAIARLGREADLFERSAYRVTGTETLKQAVPAGVRIARNARGVETTLPALNREIVSDYGFISVDEPGGAIREARNVRQIDGQTWNRKNTSLADLAKGITSGDDKSKRKQLERFEEYGLHGFVTDLGQLILLFARGNTARYEMVYETTDETGYHVYRYQQLDGKEAFTVYGEGKEPTRQRPKGHVWFNPIDKMPVRISIEAEREVDRIPIRDISTVDYKMSSLGFVLPLHIVHQQFVGGTLYVTDDFTYTNFREVLPKVKLR